MQIWDMAVKRLSVPETSRHSQITVHIGGNGWRRLGYSETFQKTRVHGRVQFNTEEKKFLISP
jgi:hypothetical protein